LLLIFASFSQAWMRLWLAGAHHFTVLVKDGILETTYADKKVGDSSHAESILFWRAGRRWT
jgi:hypothetical protein